MSRKERVKYSAESDKLKNGQMKTSDHFFFLLLIVLFVAGCSAEVSLHELCKDKISASLQRKISDLNIDTMRISIVITLRDSAEVLQSFPMLSIPNARIALGHLTKEEISALCKHKNVQYIDTPKMRFPNK